MTGFVELHYTVPMNTSPREGKVQMEDFMNKTLLAEYTERPDCVGVLCIEDKTPDIYPPEINGFDRIVIIAMQSEMALHETVQMHYGQLRVQIHRVSTWSMERWLVDGENRGIIQWLLQGEILQDPTCYLAELRKRIVKFEKPLREQRMLAEFSLFLHSYFEAKQFMNLRHEMDAYRRVIDAMGHWAGIVLIEEGMHPEVSVWKQVHNVNVAVYKLYEELTVSQETIEQRVELLLLALDFSLMSRIEAYCTVLLRVLASRAEPWSTKELVEHPYLNHVSGLPLVLRKLVKKSLVQEVPVEPEENLVPQQEASQEIHYTAVS